jgi:glucan 1,3-beta-glucosidase
MKASILCASLLLLGVKANYNYLWGIDYNPKRDANNCPTVYDVMEDMYLMSSLTNRIRIYSFSDCNMGDLVLTAAENFYEQYDFEFKVIMGMWTTNNVTQNNIEYNTMQEVFAAHDDLSNVEAVIVGSESIFRGEYGPNYALYLVNTISNYLENAGLSDIAVSYADVLQTFQKYPQLIDGVELVMMNKFPFWEGLTTDNYVAIDDIMNAWEDLMNQYPDKEIWVSESGWPDGGDAVNNAYPDPYDASIFYNQFVCYSNYYGYKYLYFGAFDDAWKQTNGVEAHWGVFNVDRTTKDSMTLDCDSYLNDS